MLERFEFEDLLTRIVSEHVRERPVGVQRLPCPVDEYALDRCVDQIPEAPLAVPQCPLGTRLVGLELESLEDSIERSEQILGMKWLAEIVVGAEMQRLDRALG